MFLIIRGQLSNFLTGCPDSINIWFRDTKRPSLEAFEDNLSIFLVANLAVWSRVSALIWVFPPNPHVEILPPKDDGIRRRGLWAVTRSWGWSPGKWVSALSYQMPRWAPASLLPVTTQGTCDEPSDCAGTPTSDFRPLELWEAHPCCS